MQIYLSEVLEHISETSHSKYRAMECLQSHWSAKTCLSAMNFELRCHYSVIGNHITGSPEARV